MRHRKKIVHGLPCPVVSVASPAASNAGACDRRLEAVRLAFSLSAALLIASCGGGSGGGDTAMVSPPVDPQEHEIRFTCVSDAQISRVLAVAETEVQGSCEEEGASIVIARTGSEEGLRQVVEILREAGGLRECGSERSVPSSESCCPSGQGLGEGGACRDLSQSDCLSEGLVLRGEEGTPEASCAQPLSQSDCSSEGLVLRGEEGTPGASCAQPESHQECRVASPQTPILGEDGVCARAAGDADCSSAFGSESPLAAEDGSCRVRVQDDCSPRILDENAGSCRDAASSSDCEGAGLGALAVSGGRCVSDCPFGHARGEGGVCRNCSSEGLVLRGAGTPEASCAQPESHQECRSVNLQAPILRASGVCERAASHADCVNAFGDAAPTASRDGACLASECAPFPVSPPQGAAAPEERPAGSASGTQARQGAAIRSGGSLAAGLAQHRNLLGDMALDAAQQGGDVDWDRAKAALWRAAEQEGGALLGQLSGIRRSRLSLSERAAAVELIGDAGQSGNAARAWHFRSRRQADGVGSSNFGLIVRRDFGDALGGANVFWDYEDPGGFLRAGAGGEWRQASAEFSANLYEPVAGDDETRYSAGGYDLAAQVRLPQDERISGVFEHSHFRGERGNPDETAWRAGLRVEAAQCACLAEIQYNRDAGEYWNAALGGRWEFGVPGRMRPSPAFRPQDFFYDPPRREYEQRIRRAANEEGDADNFYVHPIPDRPAPDDGLNGGNAGRWGEIFQRHSAWILENWWRANYENVPAERFLRFPNMGGELKRQASFYAFALAASAKTGAAGENKQRAESAAVRIVRSMAACHVANGACGGVDRWGMDDWRIANHESHVMAAAWMVHPLLDEDTRMNVARMAHFSANRVMSRPPRYALSACRDTLFEDSEDGVNGWDAWALEVAANMYPRHENAAAWAETAREYRRSALVTAADNEPGVNVTGDYAIGNHDIYPHPSYTAGGARQPLIGAIYYRLGGAEPPPENMRNVPQIYHMLYTTRWRPAGQRAAIAPDGEPIYDQEGHINWYHPWKSPNRAHNYWTYGVLDALSAIENLDSSAAEWERMHLTKLEGAQYANGIINIHSRENTTNQHNQSRDVAAAYLGYWIAPRN